MKSMKESLKFKKSIDKDGKLTYESPCGLRYSMNRYGIGESHAMSWDKLGKALEKLAEISPDFAEKMFLRLDEDISSRGGEKCNQCVFINCANMKYTEYNGKKRKSCGGYMHFKWLPSEFEDVRKIIAVVKDVIKTDDKINDE